MTMPLIIRITAEDLAGWELTHGRSWAEGTCPSCRGASNNPASKVVGQGLRDEVVCNDPFHRENSYHYRPRLTGELEQYIERIQVVSSKPLINMVGKDMVCFVNVEKGWMSRDLGVRPEVKFKLKAPAEELRDPRRLRLKIKAIDTSTRPPRVTLEDYKLEEFKG